MKYFKTASLLVLLSIGFSGAFAASPNTQQSTPATPATATTATPGVMTNIAPTASSAPKTANAPTQDSKKELNKVQPKSATKSSESTNKGIGHVKATPPTMAKHASVNTAPQSKLTKIKAS